MRANGAFGAGPGANGRLWAVEAERLCRGGARTTSAWAQSWARSRGLILRCGRSSLSRSRIPCTAAQLTVQSYRSKYQPDKISGCRSQAGSNGLFQMRRKGSCFESRRVSGNNASWAHLGGKSCTRSAPPRLGACRPCSACRLCCLHSGHAIRANMERRTSCHWCNLRVETTDSARIMG